MVLFGDMASNKTLVSRTGPQKVQINPVFGQTSIYLVMSSCADINTYLILTPFQCGDLSAVLYGPPETAVHMATATSSTA